MPSHRSNNGQSTVLLIGNSFGLLKRIAYALQHRGHSVIWGESGQTGLQIAESEEPDLIICETDLPDVSGIQICRLLKSSFFFEIPVVLVGKLRDEKTDLSRAYSAGADDYFGSFTDWQLLMAKLDWLLQRPVSEDAYQGSGDLTPICPVAGSPN